MSEFHDDLREAAAGLSSARAQLLDTVGRLTDEDLDRGRRGGWPVRKVLEHTVQSEWLYVALINHLRGRQADNAEARGLNIASIESAVKGFERSRAALLSAIVDIDEGTFYRLQRAGHDEHSVFSVLENVEMHDHEHAAHIEKIVGVSKTETADR